MHFLSIFVFFQGYQKAKDKLPVVFQQVMEDIVRTLTEFAGTSVEYNIEIGLLKIIRGKHKVLCDLFKIVQDSIKTSITAREIGVAIVETILIYDSFVEFSKLVQHVVNFCDTVVGNVGM